MNVKALTILLTLVINMIDQVFSFVYQQGQCGLNTKTQSPINIVSSATTFYEEKYFRILTNNYGSVPSSTQWEQFTQERSVGFTVNSNSTIQLVKDWSIYQFYLRKVMFRTKSEHRIDGNSFDVEMQLYHDLDESYVSVGRQQELPIKKLVISLFFMKAKDGNDTADDFFKWSNLEAFANGTTKANFNKRILLGNLVQNVPSYLYQGTYTSPDCIDTYWLILTKYATIGVNDYNNLYKLLERSQFIDISSGVNGRDTNFLVNSNLVYRNFNNLQRMLPEKSYFRYSEGVALKISLIFSLIIFFMFN